MSKPINSKVSNISQIQNDLKGLNQLSQEGIIGAVDLVEAVHQRIYTLGGLLSRKNTDKTNGLTGFIYNSIRKTTQLSIKGIDLALATFKPLNMGLIRSQQRDQWVSILNGVLGNHLVDTDNPLAIEMTLTYKGEAITPHQAAKICAKSSGEPLLLVHGLCMNDQQWFREGHDHGAALENDLDFIPIYLRYNSGLAIHQNGQQLAGIMNELITALPAEKPCHLLCHSMGGLVVRSAIQSAQYNHHNWINTIGQLIFLGTPHHGALLEKSGHLLDYIIGISPYSAPFIKLTGIRSQGIKDLREGRINKDHQFSPIYNPLNSYTIAACTQDQPNQLKQQLIGDGLVSVKSALGVHKQVNKQLNISPKNQTTINGINHFQLLSDPKVYQLIKHIFSRR